MTNIPYELDLYADDPEQGASQHQQKKKGGFSPVTLILIGAAALMMAVVAWGIYDNSQSQPENGPAPAFALPMLGEEGVFSLAQQKGDVVVINFWGSWCGPCRREAPMLQEAYEHFQAQGVVFIGVAVKDIESDALAYIDEFNITYPNVMDWGGELEESYRTQGVPETFVVDRNGDVHKFFFAQPTERDLYSAIEEALES